MIALLAAVATAGCGASPGASTPATPSGSTIRLSAGDMGRTVTVRRGATVDVSLPAAQSFEPWSTPAPEDQRVLAPLSQAPVPSPGSGTTASFNAAADGTTRVTAHARVACSASPGTACPMVVRSWSVTVKVTG